MKRRSKPTRYIPFRLLRDRCGATAVEFALVFPVFLMMAIGVIEFGRAMYVKATLQHAVERTTRYAMVNTSATEAQLETYAGTQVAGSAVSGSSFNASITSGSTPEWVTVTGTYSFNFSIPMIPLPTVTLSAKSRVPLVE